MRTVNLTPDTVNTERASLGYYASGSKLVRRERNRMQASCQGQYAIGPGSFHKRNRPSELGFKLGLVALEAPNKSLTFSSIDMKLAEP